VNVGVFGSSLPRRGSDAYNLAFELGAEIARRGAGVVCGGYGGTMEAVCRGAVEAGGSTRGVILSGGGEPNAWVQQRTVAADLGERLRILRDSSDAWVFLPHGLGTMLELVWMAESVVKAAAYPRPLVVVGKLWRASMETALAEASSPGGAEALRSVVRYTNTVPETVAAAMEGR
jgi:uncharacterized protein (TIGR00725 family)